MTASLGGRDRITAFVAAHEVAWELVMAALAVIWVAVGLIEEPAGWIPNLEVTLTVVFVLEFSTRFAASRDRRAYLRGHWIDLVALVPAVRGARILRLLRLLRLVRAFAGMYRAVAAVERLARHRGLAWLVVGWLAVMVICSAALFIAENGVNELVASPFDALWWGVSTLTTVGYGDVVPKTPEGRLAAMALMLLGIGLFSGITATITSFVLAGRSEDVVGKLAAIAELRDRGALTIEEFEAKKLELLARL